MDTAENVSTPTRIHESVEFDTNSDSENPHFSKTLEKYLGYLKSVERPKINNSELLDGVDQISRSIEGCIKLAESALGSSDIQQNPETLNPPQKWLGDVFSGIDRVDSKLINCIKMAKALCKTRNRTREEKRVGNPKRQTPGLFGWDRLPLGNPRFLHRDLLTSGVLNQRIFLILYSIRISTSSWKVLTTSNHSTTSRIGQTMSTCLWMPWPIHPRWQTLSGN